ncbi:pirin family protein [Streptacidiphilus sp. P02-A3a]|uniref:pirin family protein n=1 Tax=Streptacidiphilus sp. P02-A3a TaxID=2704468 RepID=UPI0015FAEE07|nr:pirin family protein [Streptacidiphilus sp. P02-A3a]QMU73338.1 pirin family protein [Streptacidiphilus sp. P02-A3a]
MPAVTVENPLVLPRVETPDPTTTVPRPVVQVATAPEGYEGEGFPVRRAFARVHTSLLDPFIMMDQMGEVEYAAGEPKGTPWHPHRGFETVTYLIDGKFIHRDSTGGGGALGDGDTQWMTAGSGILHIETPPEDLVISGGLFHGLQLWVNLPASDKLIRPKYQDISGSNVKLLASPDGGTLLRLIAGSIGGVQGPGTTHTPITMIHATLNPGASVTLPWRSDFNALVYALNGRGTAGAEKRPFGMGKAVVFGEGDSITIAADPTQESRSPNLDVVILGGLPIREPVAHYGPFVMNSHRELQQAMEDFQSGKFGQIPAEHS